ncbi:DUF6114 domain-containing protein [Micromonospora pattaloongensis]|uniref:DUF6114 domain-containing protein n=1 Tax=Micromonospora pattaloongensis TaxID=405436 RepID=UPI001FDF7177|nr:DUF6114 domain-containing protein [Micromonospora pattaloongensis]
MTSADPQHVRVSAPAGGWPSFRRWQRARPFWGGLFTILSGGEIFATTQMTLGGLSFQMGPTGFLSWLIPTILVACGLLMWLTPQHRMFYAIIASMTAVYSLIAVNLGGFFIGMLLGMVGGALGFAWTRVPVATGQPDTAVGDGGQPADPEFDEHEAAGYDDGDGRLADVLPRPRDPLADPVEPTGEQPAYGRHGYDRAGHHQPGCDQAGHDEPGYEHPGHEQPDYEQPDYEQPDYEQPGYDQPGYDPRRHEQPGAAGHIPTHRPGEPPVVPGNGQELPRRSPRLLAITLVLLSVSAIGLTALSRNTPALAAPACLPAVPPATPTPTATPSAPPNGDGGQEGANDGNLVTDIIDGITGILGIGDEEKTEQPAASVTPAPTVAPTAKPAATPDPTATPAPTTSPDVPGACPEKPADPTPGPDGVKRLPADPDQPPVAKKPSLLTGSKVTMRGLRMDGIVQLPTVGGGTIEALQFSMTQAVTDDFLLQAPGPAGKTMRFQTPELAVRGDVKFYASRFVGWIGPIKLTLTPESPIPPDGIPLSVPLISFTDPQMDLVFVSSNVLTGQPTLKVTLA